MLLIQNICLQWDKNARGAKGGRARRQFPHAHPTERRSVRGTVLVQNLNFYQDHLTIRDAIQEERHLSEKYRTQCEQWGQTPQRVQRELSDRIAWMKRHQYQTFASIREVSLTNLSVCRRDDALEIAFFHDRHRSGAPVRRGHNKEYQTQDSPFYRTDILNETAFVLSPGQYGRIVWNERLVDCESGTWYYQLHIYNLYTLDSENVPSDLFTKREPDYTYRQVAPLH